MLRGPEGGRGGPQKVDVCVRGSPRYQDIRRICKAFEVSCKAHDQALKKIPLNATTAFLKLCTLDKICIEPRFIFHCHGGGEAADYTTALVRPGKTGVSGL
ncbi:uncharacterized protein MYCFIDRAFT_209442 [Pseudocercospora fijiensis CIRAD86]|uniref:Uncharacterized protein n=1 Tax=Pseudocercospora fijiensis (strain CIRAD86) TaxID=383855 RepID=N1Q6W2_PSEFD|nr:uncharacterized protein MYCFIDRAFT_209442 [Pseudocercospora fijiensis CIRAD86]EME87181.1 hypothetical protein MYCFIDRAFT_209442 [Pseudocercospora fijiensis CIRAD86]